MSKPLDPTCALVIETNNLRGGEVEAVVEPLERLLARMRDQTRPLSTLHELVITHDGLPEAARARLERAAGVAIAWVLLGRDTGYYEAKNAGFAMTTAEVVVFADGDCWPEPGWLEALTAPFATVPGAQVVAGRTTYRTDALGVAASTIDFNYYASPLGQDCVKNFYANNVAFRRGVFSQHAYRSADRIYRGHCQVLGMELARAGIPIKFVPAARTVHRFPDSVRDFVQLRLHRGADARELAPHIARSALPRPLQWIGSLGPVSALAVLAPRLAYSVGALGHQDMPPQRKRDRLKSLGLIGAIHAMDLVGGLLGNRVLERGRSRAKENLAYHHG